MSDGATLVADADGTDAGDATDARDAAWIEAERQTRRTRPSTRTLSEAASVFMSFASPRIVVALALGAGVARGLSGPPTLRDVAIIAGVAVWWPLQEWAAHRWILHMRPVRGRLPMFARAHRVHHRNPSDLRTILLPPVVPLQAFAGFGVVAWLVGGSAGDTATLLLSLALAALGYEWIHFLTHTDVRPRTRWMRWVWRNHRMHHYRNERSAYAFTAPWLDAWFGTDPAEAEASSTTRSL